MLSSRKDNFYFCTLNNLLALSEFGCSAKFVSMKTCTLVITCIICPTGFAITYLWKMSLFAQEPCQKHFLKGPKGIKFTPKRNKGEKERKKRYLMFFTVYFLNKKKAKTHQNGEIRPIFYRYLFENPVRCVLPEFMHFNIRNQLKIVQEMTKQEKSCLTFFDVW